MATRTATKPVTANPFTPPAAPAAPATVPATPAPADPFASLALTDPNAFVKARKPVVVSPYVLALAAHIAQNEGVSVIDVEGWDAAKLRAFRKQLTTSDECRNAVAGRRFLIREGNASGRKALAISLSKVPEPAASNGQ